MPPSALILFCINVAMAQEGISEKGKVWFGFEGTSLAKFQHVILHNPHVLQQNKNCITGIVIYYNQLISTYEKQPA